MSKIATLLFFPRIVGSSLKHCPGHIKIVPKTSRYIHAISGDSEELDEGEADGNFGEKALVHAVNCGDMQAAKFLLAAGAQAGKKIEIKIPPQVMVQMLMQDGLPPAFIQMLPPQVEAYAHILIRSNQSRGPNQRGSGRVGTRNVF